MSVVYSGLVSYHTNPYTCGVARFNQALSAALKIPIVAMSNLSSRTADVLLLSLKFEEISHESAEQLLSNLQASGTVFDLFLHGIVDSEIEQVFVRTARQVFVASNA